MMPEVVIIGGGLAGLCCARKLSLAGIDCVIHEASDDIGGRVRTDAVDGFLLDRGFQVLLTAYPECRSALDYDALELQPFFPGAMVRFESRFHVVADPFRAPESTVSTILSPIGSLADKFRIARLRASLGQYSLPELFQRQELTTRERLAQEGFSAAMIDRFFRPFFGGIFLEPELRTSSRVFDFVFRMLAEGAIAVPRHGMRAIPKQIAGVLPGGVVQLNRPVMQLDQVSARAVVIATQGAEAVRLLGVSAFPKSRSVWCYYFAADQPPHEGNVLFLNGDGTGPVNNCCILTNVSSSYGPPGAALISASVLETVPEHSEQSVRAQMVCWFGAQAASWRLLRRQYVQHAQPEQAPPALSPPEKDVRIRPGLYVCGDHRENASINGAMVSGRRAAEAVIRDLRR